MKSPIFFKKRVSSLRGFTLIELLVVISVTVYLTLNLLSNFFRSDVNIDEVAKLVIADIRQAQANALSSKQFAGTYRCGYGFHMLKNGEDSANEPLGQTYYVYAHKRDSTQCSSKDYQNSDAEVATSRVLDVRVMLCGPSSGPDPCNIVASSNNVAKSRDIFFESPLAKTYIEKIACPATSSPSVAAYSQILLIKKGTTTCPGPNCRYICAYKSGKIEYGNSECVPEDC